jgi:hypothetical protein
MAKGNAGLKEVICDKSVEDEIKRDINDEDIYSR